MEETLEQAPNMVAHFKSKVEWQQEKVYVVGEMDANTKFTQQFVDNFIVGEDVLVWRRNGVSAKSSRQECPMRFLLHNNLFSYIYI